MVRATAGSEVKVPEFFQFISQCNDFVPLLPFPRLPIQRSTDCQHPMCLLVVQELRRRQSPDRVPSALPTPLAYKHKFGGGQRTTVGANTGTILTMLARWGMSSGLPCTE